MLSCHTQKVKWTSNRNENLNDLKCSLHQRQAADAISCLHYYFLLGENKVYDIFHHCRNVYFKKLTIKLLLKIWSCVFEAQTDGQMWLKCFNAKCCWYDSFKLFLCVSFSYVVSFSTVIFMFCFFWELYFCVDSRLLYYSHRRHSSFLVVFCYFNVFFKNHLITMKMKITFDVNR